LFWETGLTTIEFENSLGAGIVTKLKEIDFDKSRDIIADNDNRAITELVLSGYSIYPAQKGEVVAGLKMMKSFYIYITKRSINLINEFENYKRQIDKNGVILPKPIHENCHGIDGTRYSVEMKNYFW